MNMPILNAADSITDLIDCDIHPFPRTPNDIAQFLPQRWQEHGREYGSNIRSVFSNTIAYPRITPFTARLDSWPPGGGLPASDLDFMREQLLDRYNVALGILQPLRPAASSQRNLEYGSALCAAINDWQYEVLLPGESRLRASIMVHPEDPDAAVAEIARCAGKKGFVQVSLPPRGLEPLGRRRFWPIFEAAAAHGLPIGLHVSGVGGHAATAGGWPSYYIEEHHSLVQMMQATTTSLIIEGVFERFPSLRVVMIESGIAWVPALRARMDRVWRRLRSEVPHLKRLPSEYLRDHFWFTTQPIDEPERDEDLIDLFDQVGWDRIMLSTDYPHWDFDDPSQLLRRGATHAQRLAVFRDNARGFYGELLA